MSLQNILIILGTLVVLGLAGVYFAFHNFYGSIYQFHQTVKTPEEVGLDGVKVVEFTSEDGEQVGAWVKAPEAGKPAIFFFMGNWSAVGPAAEKLKPFIEDGYGLAALIYRGSSGAGGTPNEENLTADARALYDQLDDLVGTPVPASQRVIQGGSLGSGVAVQLAHDRPVAGLVLVAAFGRFCDYFTDRHHGLPFCYLMWKERYDSVDKIADVNAPLLMLHGEKDTGIRIESAERLFDAAVEPKEFARFEDGTHVNLFEIGAYDKVFDFYGRVVSSD